MAFTVETGTGSSSSNAYIDITYADTYHEDRGNTKWNGSSAQKQSAIVRATDYIDKRFGRSFRGEKTTREQALEWPRLAAHDNDDWLIADSDEIPAALKKACAEYALRALLNGELAPDPSLPVPGQNNAEGSTVTSDVVTGEIVSKREKVGSLEVETKYRSSSENKSSNYNTALKSSMVQDSILPEYPAADLYLEELIKASSSKGIVRG